MSAEPSTTCCEAVPLPTPVPRRRRWVSVLLALVIFFCGLAIGVGGTLVTVVHQMIHQIQHPEEAPPRMAARLGKLLKLAPDQQAQVEEILRARQLALQQIRREAQPRVEKELGLVERQIAAVLDDQQRELWHSTCERLRATWVPPMPDAPAKAE
jgi:hypothetical protein